MVSSNDNNGQICTCTGRHILWANDNIQQHPIAVYCKYRLCLQLGITSVHATDDV